MSAKITNLTITFDDVTVEADFYETLSKVNPQAMIDALGLNTLEEIQSITADDKKAFVLSQFRAQMADSYVSTKQQQAIAALQRDAAASGKPLEAESLPKKVQK